MSMWHDGVDWYAELTHRTRHRAMLEAVGIHPQWDREERLAFAKVARALPLPLRRDLYALLYLAGAQGFQEGKTVHRAGWLGRRDMSKDAPQNEAESKYNYLDKESVFLLTPIKSNSTLYDMIRRGDFPKPVKMGKRSFWKESEVLKWLDDFDARR